MRILLVVDAQKDFCPGGALGVMDGNKIMPRINKLIQGFDHVIASRDWHPEDTIHFEKWPPHCIRETEGAEFHDELSVRKFKKIFNKGTGNKDDGYSAFEATNENLHEYLQENNVNELYLAGLTTEYCIKQTALDAIRLGYKTFVFKDAIAPVDMNPGDAEAALEEIQDKGVVLLSTKTIMA